ncbi:MAG: signal peptidase II [Alphaproteobacteria bacterium]|nr:signal peptidase II [Alphaproteobacteria bacterium]
MKNIFKMLAVIVGAVILDQVSKGFLIYLITGDIPLAGPAWEIVPVPYLMAHVTDFFNIVFTWNPGASFSLFRGLGEIAPLLIIIATGVIIGFIGYYAIRRAAASERLPLALILGGAIGNLIDRIRFGAVVDFLDFHIGTIHWPAFNVADICICIGVALYILNWFIACRGTATKGGK